MWRFLATFQRRRRDETPLQRIERVVSRLDRTTREIFLAHRLDDMSYTEIAERTGLSVKQVESRMAKAMRRLAEAELRD
ncbi:sigma factor-like helix-turn-helix DNA-binding protein [Sphingomonas sp. G-3-2-10]|uniref:sigma factor-like helix-turn-helix DNA-binding protein n=1 Tax=Sphingomonas sp. G-3-2-10 TaxID=2728838 RepID=UPI00146B90D2|nr:sigma factor-like helix-turn-helix DNA-binding protein [Sphingomonas sp. G-3-2-10]NML05963.1 RNA polymerase subunit sigma [Sphingomonas sp. G-3-2-10]